MPVTLSPQFSDREMHILLDIARKAINDQLEQRHQMPDLSEYPDHLQQPGACFVTLEVNQQLQGCLGVLEAQRPLVEEVYTKAQAAASQDPRFPPLKQSQLAQLTFEVSVLNAPQSLAIADESDLEAYLQTHRIGVILSDRKHRAVFLPQVWAQLPQPSDFIKHLKRKAGWPDHYWSNDIAVETFTVTSANTAY